MSSVIKRRGGTTDEHQSFTGASREITIDTDKKTVVIHDGITAGGFPLAREDLSNVARNSIFHGLYEENGILKLSSGLGEFIAEDYLSWFISQFSWQFSINDNGELIAEI